MRPVSETMADESERPFCVGAFFPDFETFQAALKSYQDQKKVLFSIRHSRTVAAALKNGLKAIPACLKYSYAKYECKHAGSYASNSSQAFHCENS